jgi:hypothetical protein
VPEIEAELRSGHSAAALGLLQALAIELLPIVSPESHSIP